MTAPADTDDSRERHDHTRFRINDEPWSPCPRSCPAAEPTGELREQVARAYAAWVSSPYDPTHWQTENGFDLADALLSGPLAPLLAKLQAVEDLADDLSRSSEAMHEVRAERVAESPDDPTVAYADAVARNVAKEWAKIAARLRRALGGTA